MQRSGSGSGNASSNGASRPNRASAGHRRHHRRRHHLRHQIMSFAEEQTISLLTSLSQPRPLRRTGRPQRSRRCRQHFQRALWHPTLAPAAPSSGKSSRLHKGHPNWAKLQMRAATAAAGRGRPLGGLYPQHVLTTSSGLRLVAGCLVPAHRYSLPAWPGWRTKTAASGKKQTLHPCCCAPFLLSFPFFGPGVVSWMASDWQVGHTSLVITVLRLTLLQLTMCVVGRLYRRLYRRLYCCAALSASRALQLHDFWVACLPV